MENTIENRVKVLIEIEKLMLDSAKYCESMYKNKAKTERYRHAQGRRQVHEDIIRTLKTDVLNGDVWKLEMVRDMIANT